MHQSVANDEPRTDQAIKKWPPAYAHRENAPSRQHASLNFNREFGTILVESATSTVSDLRYLSSARVVVTKNQKQTIMTILSFLALAMILANESTLIILVFCCSAFFLANAIFKLCLFGQAAPVNQEKPVKSSVQDDFLPSITILVPLYEEAATLPSIISALSAIDYPRQKLDIKFVFEEGDTPTISMAQKLIRDLDIEIIITPDFAPRTKPKACNYALFQATGDIIVIYDAEDIPDTQQLRKAAHAFFTGTTDLACVQSRLNYYNSRENWLTGLFALEYYSWFGFFLPGLQKLNAPIPLGGTSNFIRTDVLRKLGAWDAFNVTEDADLGLRLARAGYKTEIIESETLEEATCTIRSWIKQRTRWIKGHLQTWLVHIRSDSLADETDGFGARVAVHLFLAGNFFSALVAPILWLFFGVSYLGGINLPGALDHPTLNQLSIFILMVGYISAIVMNLAAALVNKRLDLVGYIFFVPAYWIANSVAAYRAVYELITNPFYWSKTRHVQSPLAQKRHTQMREKLLG